MKSGHNTIIIYEQFSMNDINASSIVRSIELKIYELLFLYTFHVKSSKCGNQILLNERTAKRVI